MTQLSRRHLLRALGAGALLVPFSLQACLEPVGAKVGNLKEADSGPDLALGDAHTDAGGPPDVGEDIWEGETPDTWTRFEDTRADVQRELETKIDQGSGLWPIVIAEDFLVHLGDTACTSHAHQCFVKAGFYEDNTPVQVHGGHPMALHPLEMRALESGEQLPYHTLPHGSHHHCGTAIRHDLFTSDFDGDDSRLKDFFQCKVPELEPVDTPEQFKGLPYGDCVNQKT